MKRAEILSNIAAKCGISELNAMQNAMATTDARNIILIAPTGSGKTLAFAIRMLRNVDAKAPGIKAVVLAPTRELVIQIAEVIRPVAEGLKTVVLYGGHAMTDEVNSLNGSPADIVVATPGRLVDHINRRTIDIRRARTLVIDEYDKMLELGFEEQMGKVVRMTSDVTLRMLTSATRIEEWPDYMGNIADYAEFDFGADVVDSADTTEIIGVPSDSRDKLDTLVALLRSLDNQRVIVFVNHRESAERVYERLRREGFPAGLYHGGLEQQERRRAVDLLDNGTTPILVATDLASRGLDIDGVGSVVHYHMPTSPQAWKHRNGRTGRQGAEGRVFVITSPGEQTPEYVTHDRMVDTLVPSSDPIRSDMATIYFNAGKKEKISRGDIAGYLMQRGGLSREQVGKIVVDDHWAIAAVERKAAPGVLREIAPHKIKNQRVKTSLLK